MNQETIDRYLPPKPGYRRFQIEVENGCGDIATPLIYVREDRNPRQYAATAIAKARGIFADEGPWRVGPYVEVGAGVGR